VKRDPCSVWIMCDSEREARSIADWFERTIEQPRYLISGHAIAVAFSCDADEVLFDLTFPQFRRP